RGRAVRLHAGDRASAAGPAGAPGRHVPGDRAMMSGITELLWWLVAVQIAMGAFDTLYHHELTERLAWRPSQRRELTLHPLRNRRYAVLFLMLAWLKVYGLLELLVMVVLAVEVLITLWDFVEEDLSRRLPASERINHTLLAVNYGAILVLLMPVLADWARLSTGFVATS